MTDGHRWIVDSQEKLEFFIDFVKGQFSQGSYHLYSIKPAGRTERQNNAMHLWFRQMAEKLNDAGYSNAHPFNDQVRYRLLRGWSRKCSTSPSLKPCTKKRLPPS